MPSIYPQTGSCLCNTLPTHDHQVTSLILHMVTWSHPSPYTWSPGHIPHPTHGHQVTSLTQSFVSVKVSVHLAFPTPPLAFQVFDEDVRRCFAAQCTAVDTSDHAWHQARLGLSRGGLGLSRGGLGLSRGGLGLSRGSLGLSRGGLGLSRGGLGLSRGSLGLSRGGLGLSRGGLGLRSLTQHSPTAYIASLCTSGFRSQSQHHLASAIQLFNSSVPPSEAINSEVLLLTKITQKSFSSKLDNHLFKVLLDISSVADKARLLPSCSITAISHSFRGSRSPS